MALALLVSRVAGAAAQPQPLDLQGWLELARSRAPALAAAAARVEEEAGRLTFARSSRGPRLEASLTYLRFEDAPAVALGALGEYSPLQENNYLARLSVTQPLYTFGRVTAGIETAEWSARAAESFHAQAEVELTAAVARAYDDVLL
ncbi:MAG: TolC family protein, partial [Gammaproteobacteria bacterium]|nr:TolC family protein [Gammaproteobacteria bacterium]